MARFEAGLPTDILNDVDFLKANAVDIFKGMTKAGAKVAGDNMKRRVKSALRSGVGDKVNSKLRITKSYETKKKEITTAARYYGYVTKKDGKPFYITKSGKKYGPYPGVPAALLVNLADSGKSIKSTMVPQFLEYWNGIKYPIVTPAFADRAIETAMLKEQERLSKGLLK